MADYCYSPLKDDEIRLLVLYPEPRGDSATSPEHIESRIIHVPRDQPPEYEALSYCWGKSNVKHTIQVGGRALTVGENLFSALSHLRGEASDDPRHFWIDAVCINQQDQQERSCQVLRMGSIYERACRVIIWLGQTPKSKSWDLSKREPVPVTRHRTDRDLLYFIEHPDDAMKSLEAYTYFQTSLRALDYSSNHYPEIPFAFQWDACFVETLGFVLADPWFNRRWVVQELAFAKTAVVQFGRCRAEWAAFVNFVHLIQEAIDGMGSTRWGLWRQPFTRDGRPCFITSKMIDGLVFASTGLIRGQGSNHGEKPSKHLCTLESLVIKLAGFNTSEPRDIIYSVLSLARDGNAIEPDYKKPVGEVFAELVEHVVRTTSRLEIICHPWARLYGPLASWVNVRIDDHLQPRGSDSGVYHSQKFEQPLLHLNKAADYAASKNVCAECSFTSVDTHRILRASGLRVNTIRRLGVTAVRPFISYRESGRVRESCYYETTSGFLEDAFRAPAGDSVGADFFRVVAGGNLTTGINVQKDLNSVQKDLQLSWTEEDKFQDWMKPLYGRIELVCCYRRLMRTSTGLLGLVPRKAQVGDLICVLFGCRIPLVLRPQDGRYIIVGECYVDGLMEGQAITKMEEGKLQKMNFDIQ